ncbi:uncharacterized protein BDW43DRAFT_192881 [Aspergillus alliaceus]|uniref:uncharacterized protein n=1 Tax=Petromyces alliaceus TaxID=209559 RepID=UPI0012A62796|nr:uncharacterized protein BDW43DRAFT_192881 [Aspergillus alliaceus]KAB8229332.1 hypothetical protein BDW43DRAFT_192881 [Aspergillus alliaceus]
MTNFSNRPKRVPRSRQPILPRNLAQAVTCIFTQGLNPETLDRRVEVVAADHLGPVRNTKLTSLITRNWIVMPVREVRTVSSLHLVPVKMRKNCGTMLPMSIRLKLANRKIPSISSLPLRMRAIKTRRPKSRPVLQFLPLASQLPPYQLSGQPTSILY